MANRNQMFFIKKALNGWKLLHKSGIYFLWATVWTTYWYELYYYDDIQFIDYIYYWTGLLAYSLRVVAWSKTRLKNINLNRDLG